MRVDWGLFQILLVVLNYWDIGELCCDLHMCSTLGWPVLQGWFCSYFMLFQCEHVYLRTQWWSADIQHPFSETSWRDLFCIPHRSDRHLCMLGMVRMHWLKEHSGSFRYFVAFHQGLCARCSNLQACSTICGCVAPRGVMWHDLTWCVMFESLWWSSKLIRCQRMRLHPKHEDKPCASTEVFSTHCWLYWIIEILESFVATCTCVLHLAGLCCKVDFVVISCYFNVDMCTWERNDDQQISNTLSLRLLEEICSASLIALIGTCACWAWYACIGWKSIQDHSGTSLHFIKGFVHIAAICKLAPQSVVVWHHVVWGDMLCHAWVPVMIFETN